MRVDRRAERRTTAQRVRFWTKKVLRIFFVAYILGLLTMVAITHYHKHKHDHDRVGEVR